MIARIRRFLRDARGVTAIEAALVLPVVLAFVAGTFEYSRVLLGQNMIRDIIDEAARTAAVTNLSDSDVLDLVDDGMNGVPGMSDYSISATTSSGLLTITVECEFDVIFSAIMKQSMINFSVSVVYPRS